MREQPPYLFSDSLKNDPSEKACNLSKNRVKVQNFEPYDNSLLHGY